MLPRTRCGPSCRRQVGYRFKARGSYAALMPAQLSTPDMVTPADFAEWCGFGIAGEAVAHEPDSFVTH